MRGLLVSGILLMLAVGCGDSSGLLGEGMTDGQVAVDAVDTDAITDAAPSPGDGRADGPTPEPDVSHSDAAGDAAMDATPVVPPDAGTQCPPADVDCDGIEPHNRNAPNRYPIVLVHGMGGFENLGPIGYYFGIPRLLRQNGYDVHVTVTDPFNSSEVRAEQLAPQIDHILACTCRPKVNLIGHSQGGIDIRLLVSGFDYADRVASVTTIASPHQGTAIADALLGITGDATGALLDMFTSLFTGIVYGPPMEDPRVRAAMTSCSVANLVEFNAEHPNIESVAYYSYAGFTGVLADGRPECEGTDRPVPRRGDIVHPGLLAGFLYLGGPETANDGLVTVESAKWGRFLGCVAADHLDEIGQLAGVVDSFDYRRFYLDVAGFIADEGF